MLPPVKREFKRDGALIFAGTSKVRFKLLPNVPTMTEAGLSGVELSQNFGVAIRSGTPQPIIDRLNKEINVVLV